MEPIGPNESARIKHTGDTGGSHSANWPICEYCYHHWGDVLEGEFLVLKGSDVVETVITCPVCEKAGLRILLKVISVEYVDIEGAKHWQSKTT